MDILNKKIKDLLYDMHKKNFALQNDILHSYGKNLDIPLINDIKISLEKTLKEIEKYE